MLTMSPYVVETTAEEEDERRGRNWSGIRGLGMFSGHEYLIYEPQIGDIGGTKRLNWRGQ